MLHYAPNDVKLPGTIVLNNDAIKHQSIVVLNENCYDNPYEDRARYTVECGLAFVSIMMMAATIGFVIGVGTWYLMGDTIESVAISLIFFPCCTGALGASIYLFKRKLRMLRNARSDAEHIIDIIAMVDALEHQRLHSPKKLSAIIH